MRKLFDQFIRKYQKLSILMKIAFWLGLVSFFINLKFGLILCGIVTLISIYDTILYRRKLIKSLKILTEEINRKRENKPIPK